MVAISIFPLLATLDCQAAIYADTWISLSNATVGVTLTGSLWDGGTVNKKNATWSITGTGPNLQVAAHQIDRPTPLLVGFTNQPNGQYQKALALNNANNFTFGDFGLLPSGRRVMNYFGWINLGPTEISKPQYFDCNGIYGATGAYIILQLRNGTGPAYQLNIETDGAGTLHSADITVSRATWYWFNLRANFTSGTAELWVYDQYGTLVGDVTVPQKTGMDISKIRVGNMEGGTSPGTTTYWQDLGIDYTYADYVPVARDGNIIPMDRRADWNNAGFVLPTASTVYAHLPTSATYADVVNALAACPPNQVVQLDAGDHTWADFVDFSTVGNGKVLRGTQLNGTNATRVVWSGTRAIWMRNSPDESKLAIDLNLSANIRKGDTKILAALVPAWCQPGLLLGLDQLNDEIRSTTNTAHEMAGIARARNTAGANGNRGQGEMVLIAATNATTITTAHPILHDFAANRAAQIFMPGYDMSNSSKSPRTQCGIENIDFFGSAGALMDADAIALTGCYQCWVTGCGSFLSRSTHILTQFAYQCVISGNVCSDASTFAAGQGGGITLYDLSCRNLIENNIVRRSSVAYQASYGSCGNVFGYNYALESHSDSGDGPDLNIHGNSADYNLFEGNFGDGKAKFECVQGSSYCNTLFKNSLMGSVATEIQNGNPNNQIALDVDYWNHDFVIVGNLCGSPGFHDAVQIAAPNSCTAPSKYVYKWGYVNASSCDAGAYDPYSVLNPVFHGNYDTVTAGVIWDPNIPDHNLPSSLYLAGKPSWFGLLTWPPFNAANASTAIVTNIPAGYRYVFGSAPTQPPTLSAIADQLTTVGLATAALPFTVGDADTAVGSLTVSGSSSNPTLVANGDIVFGGSGANRTVTVTPAAGQTGVATITVTVSDGVNTANDAFVLTVNAVNTPPTITGIGDQTINEDTSTGPLSFTIGDGETAAGSLTLSKGSSNLTLIPINNIVFEGSGANRTVTVSPAANQFGSATITLTVGDGQYSASTSLVVNVTAVNDAPTITRIANQTINVGAGTGPLAFTIGDVDTAAGSLTVGASSSNPTLVPNANVVLGGNGVNRTVTVTGAAGQSGSATITLTVGDGQSNVSTNFVVTVSALITGTASFTNTAVVTIPDVGAATPYPSAITVSSMGGTINNVTLRLTGLTHNWPDDIDIILVSPTGQKLYVMSDAGGGHPLNNLTLTFADSATAALSDQSQLATGTFKPTNYDTNTDVFVAPAPVGPYATNLTVFNGQNANGVWSLYVQDDGAGGLGTIGGGWSLTITTAGASSGAAPTLSALADVATTIGTATAALPFMVGDADTAVGSLTVSGSSSNPTLVPNGNIVFGGSGANRTVKVTPAAGQTGVATITVTVSDGVNTTNDAFVLTVNAVNTPPTITGIGDQTINEDTSTAVLSFTVGDAETLPSNLTLSKGSSNPTLIPTANIVFGGSGANRTVTVSPAANQSGSATITLTVGDGQYNASSSFVVTVSAVNDAPTMTGIANQTLNVGAGTGPLAFTIGDVDTAVGSLTVGASSSNPTLVPNANVVLGGSGANRTVTVTGAAGQSGSATITLTVGDGQSNVSTNFGVTVSALITGPASSPGFADQASSAIEGAGSRAVNGRSVSLNVGGANPLLIAAWHSEYDAGFPNNWRVECNGLPGTLLTDTNGYTGGAGNRRFRTYYWLNPSAGTKTILVTNDFSVTDNEVSMVAILVTNVASSAPIGPIALDVSTTARTAESETVASTTSDLVVHIIADALVTRGALGSGETSRSVANDGKHPADGDASLWLSTKPGGTSSTTVSSSGWASRVLNGVAIVVHGSGSAGPTLSALADVATTIGTATAALPFTVGDADTAVGSLTVSGSSSNPTLVPNGNIVFGGSGANRTVKVTPAAGQTGVATITVTVSDGVNTANDAFLLTVNAVNTPPTITGIEDQSINEDTSTAALDFTIGDGETAPGSLTLSKGSSNLTLIPINNIVFEGSGANRTVTVSPAGGQTGSAIITVTVSDGALTASNSFVLTVNAVNTPPTITGIGEQTIDEDTSTAALSFTVGDAETLPSNLTLSKGSSNPALIPSANLVLGGSGASRTVTVSPAAGQSGSTTITLTVGDGQYGASTSFVVNVTAVNDAPTITGITNQTISVDETTGPLAFTIGDVDTAVESLTVSGDSSNPALVPVDNIVFEGTGASQTVTVSPAAGQTGVATIMVTVSDGALTASNSFVLTVNAVNTPPTITGIGDQTINEDTSTAALSFTIGDAESALGSLALSKGSSNTNLVPTANIVLGGSGANRMVTVNPATNQSGSATIVLTVGDGQYGASTSFVVNVTAVNDAPTLTGIANQTINAGATTGPLAFTIGDVDTAVESLTVSGSSSNPALVTNGNIVFEGTGASQTVTVSPVANQSGSAIITVTVSDGALMASNSFVLTVNAVNTPPTITGIGDQTIDEDTSTAALGFTVGDAESALGGLTLSKGSSNTNLVPTANIVLGGSGANRTVTVNPAANQSGSATIVLTVGDGQYGASTSFVVNVTAVNDAPTIGAIAVQAIDVDGTVGPLIFTIGDVDTPVTSLGLSGSSSNPTLVANGDIVFGGSGANRTVTVSPAAGQTGVTTITVSVSDGQLSASNSFVVTVSLPVTGTRSFTNATAITIPSVGVATPYPASLNVTGMGGAISNVTVTLYNITHQRMRDIDLLLVGPGGQKLIGLSDVGPNSAVNNVTLTLSDAAAASLGTGTITSGTYKPTNSGTGDTFAAPAPAEPYGTNFATFKNTDPNGAWLLYVVDDSSGSTGSIAGGWSLTVTTMGPQPPSISAFSDQSTTVNTATAAIPFQIGDVDTPVTSLGLSGSSSNPTLVANGDIVFGGSGANRTVTVSPAAGQTGVTTITVSVSDGQLSASNSFVVTVSLPVTGTRSFTNATAITIPSVGVATPYPASLNVTGMGGAISNVTVTLYNITHQRMRDIDLLLVGPGGQKLIGLSDVGPNSAVNNVTLTLSDAAAASLGTGTITSGTYKPTNSGTGDTFAAPAPAEPYGTNFATFKNTDPNGAWLLYVVDDSSGSTGTIAGGWSLTITTTGGGSAGPTLSALADVATTIGTATAALPFTVGDADTAVGSLTVSGSSSNPTLVPNGNIVFGGSGANRTVKVTPAAGQTGVATITVAVSDGVNTASDAFVLTVNAVNTPPTITGIGDQTLNEDTSTGPLSFTIGDGETAAGSLTLSKGSSNPTLIPTANIVFGGSGANRTVTVSPAANQFGSATITVTVGDGQYSASTSLVVTVSAVNDAPTITGIANQTINVGASTGPLAFTIGDVDTAVGSLTVGASSSNPTLVPNASLVLGGSGANRTVTVTGAAGQSGSATITLTVGDGQSNVSTNFGVTVSALITGTASFTNTAVVTIPDVGAATPYPSVVNVTGLSGTISNVTVTLRNISHTWPDDIDMLLVGPGGQKVMIFSDVGGSADANNITVTLSDAAAAGLPDNGPLVSGTFKPTDVAPGEARDLFPAPAPAGPYPSTLATFNGLSANGDWSLYVQDDGAGDQGTISGGWSLTITTAGAGLADTAVGASLTRLVLVEQQPPQITSVVSDGRGAIRITVSGEAGLSYALEATSDFSNWTQVDVQENVTGAIAFTDQPTNSARFYRAVSIPQSR